MIDGEVRNIEVKVLSVRPSVRLPDICTHRRFDGDHSSRRGSLLPDSVSLSESPSLSCCSTNFVSLQKKLPHPASQTMSFSSFFFPSFLRRPSPSSLIDHLVIGYRVVEVVFVPAGSVHVSVLQAHLNTTGFPIKDSLSSVLDGKTQLSP